MLIKCPECLLQVSDKAIACPHCGFPLSNKKISKPTTKRKHQRLPNGFGQITELTNPNLRNRFRAMISEGKTEYGKPIQKMLKPKAYFSTYREAYEALLEYHRNPYDMDKDLTLEEVYEKWMAHLKEQAAIPDSLRQYRSAWAYCSTIKKIKIKDLRSYHIKNCIANAEKHIDDNVVAASPQTKSKMKIMFNTLLDYALEYELVDRNYSRVFKLSNSVQDELDGIREHHMSFTQEEMDTLWNHADDLHVQLILIQCYMGWRPQELCGLKLSNMNLDEHYIIGGLKTKSGRNRKVPIHPKIESMIKSNAKRSEYFGSEYIFLVPDRRSENKWIRLTYNNYYRIFNTVIKKLNLDPNHKTHDPRKQFVTAAKKAGLDNVAIKKIIGHAVDDITEEIYTDRDFSWLYDEACKIS